MKREDKWKEAFTSVAMEQTEQLEKSLTYEERRKSEALYKHHHDTALRLIRKQKVSIVKWVSGIAAVAAAVLFVVWGANRPAPDIITPATAPVSTEVSVYTNEPLPTETATLAMQTPEPTLHIPELEAHLVSFPENMRYAVYTGPGEHYERANDNKAVVSTNDWIEVFGVDKGYAMIQYAITSTQRRIGYIDAAALPAYASVTALEFSYLPVLITRETEMTDDPLGEKTPLHILSADTEARWLATMDDWVYLEWNGGDQPARGFVPVAAIRVKSVE
ncbi:MAG: hypothetical protein IJ153_07105 [Clostridia bacterium]|nr:hypothetical protein [Clostridia bacterium]